MPLFGKLAAIMLETVGSLRHRTTLHFHPPQVSKLQYTWVPLAYDFDRYQDHPSLWYRSSQFTSLRQLGTFLYPKPRRCPTIVVNPPLRTCSTITPSDLRSSTIISNTVALDTLRFEPAWLLAANCILIDHSNQLDRVYILILLSWISIISDIHLCYDRHVHSGETSLHLHLAKKIYVRTDTAGVSTKPSWEPKRRSRKGKESGSLRRLALTEIRIGRSNLWHEECHRGRGTKAGEAEAKIRHHVRRDPEHCARMENFNQYKVERGGMGVRTNNWRYSRSTQQE